MDDDVDLERELFYAAKEGRYERIKSLIRRGADVRALTSNLLRPVDLLASRDKYTGIEVTPELKCMLVNGRVPPSDWNKSILYDGDQPRKFKVNNTHHTVTFMKLKRQHQGFDPFPPPSAIPPAFHDQIYFNPNAHVSTLQRWEDNWMTPVLCIPRPVMNHMEREIWTLNVKDAWYIHLLNDEKYTFLWKFTREIQEFLKYEDILNIPLPTEIYDIENTLYFECMRHEDLSISPKNDQDANWLKILFDKFQPYLPSTKTNKLQYNTFVHQLISDSGENNLLQHLIQTSPKLLEVTVQTKREKDPSFIKMMEVQNDDDRYIPLIQSSFFVPDNSIHKKIDLHRATSVPCLALHELLDTMLVKHKIFMCTLNLKSHTFAFLCSTNTLPGSYIRRSTFYEFMSDDVKNTLKNKVLPSKREQFEKWWKDANKYYKKYATIKVRDMNNTEHILNNRLPPPNDSILFVDSMHLVDEQGEATPIMICADAEQGSEMSKLIEKSLPNVDHKDYVKIEYSYNNDHKSKYTVIHNFDDSVLDLIDDDTFFNGVWLPKGISILSAASRNAEASPAKKKEGFWEMAKSLLRIDQTSESTTELPPETPVRLWHKHGTDLRLLATVGNEQQITLAVFPVAYFGNGHRNRYEVVIEMIHFLRQSNIFAFIHSEFDVIVFYYRIQYKMLGVNDDTSVNELNELLDPVFVGQMIEKNDSQLRDILTHYSHFALNLDWMHIAEQYSRLTEEEHAPPSTPPTSPRMEIFPTIM